MYFETEVIGTKIDPIIGKGFFDKEGYVEPPAPSPSRIGLILGITLPIVAVLTGLGLYFYCKKKE